jgi:hypothetical protein
MSERPFLVPRLAQGDLGGLHRYWQKLKRGQAEMPFADDVKLTATGRPDAVMLIDVLENPLRFRFAIVGEGIQRLYGSELAGLYADDAARPSPFDFFLSQAAATVEGRAPTYFSSESYARLLLPLWGDGRITMLIGAVSPKRSDGLAATRPKIRTRKGSRTARSR